MSLAQTSTSPDQSGKVPPAPPSRGGTFGALRRYPDFRLYWLGACLSNVGTWMQMLAQGWLVYELTRSPFLLGLVTFVGAVPILLLALLGGALADRFERRRLMVWTQSIMMVLAFVLAGLTFSGLITVAQIMVIAALNGIVNAINTPARQSIIADLVPRADLPNAIALNSAQFQTSRMAGPALAGVMIATFGPASCFLLNGFSFLAVIAVLLRVRVPPVTVRSGQSLIRNVAAGLTYVRTQPTILMLLMIAAVPSVFGQTYQAMMPAVAASLLATDALGLGLLQASAGAGALVGALFIAAITQYRRRGRLQLWLLLLFGILLGAFSFSRWLPLSLLIVFGVGMTSMAYSSLNMTFLQSMVADEMRGRLMSLLTIVTLGLQPVGALQAGFIGTQVGVAFALLLGGIVCVLVSLVASRVNRAQLDSLS